MIYSTRLRSVVTSLAVAIAGIAVAGAAPDGPAVSPDGVWRSVDQLPAATADARVDIKATKFKTYGVDRQQLSARLSQARMEFTAASAQNAAPEITLPRPDGSFARFRVEEIAIMEPGLAAKYPDIKAYRGRGVDDPAAVLHLDVNPLTLHAQVLSPAGTWYIDPYRQHDDSVYMSYAKNDLLEGDRDFKCLVDDAEGSKGTQTTTAAATGGTSTSKAATAGTMLRTYRIAFATSAQYSLYHGGPAMEVPKILAAIVTMNNRVSGVYETELGIRMILVENQEAIIATPTNPTPYSDTPGDIGTNPAYLDTKIGEPNYDIGHVVTTGSGGIAGLGVVCRGFNVTSGGSAKARGTTGTNPPVGDAFWIDFVAHEIGHQFGGNHTFDGTGTNCGTNQNEETAYEVGSGTTIQAYAGICGNQNTQSNSDPFFHFISLKEMFGYASGAAGRTPGVVLQKSASSGGEPPLVLDASPSSGTLNPTGPDITWKGTATGGAAADEETCVEGVTCDTYTLTLSGEPGDWQNKNARITFTWPSPVDDYDIFVHKGGPDGPIVDDAATSNNPEVINIDPAAREVGTGVFTVRVVYFAVVPPAQQYTAVASAIDTSIPGDAPTCAVLTPTGNTPPTVSAGPDYKIPARTPFTLTAAGSDAEGDTITYSWEEADLGPAPKDARLPDDATNPLFRAFAPILSPRRTYPSFPYILNNANVPPLTYTGKSPTGANCMESGPCVIGEQLPTTTRELNFNVTARDNVFGGWSMDTMKLNVIDGGKGFAVTAPNAAATFEGGGAMTVTWDVANTTGPEINTTNVNILLAVDSGLGPNGEEPVFRMLLANTPNDGSEVVTLPRVNTAKARIMVQAVGNVFFDVSDADFTIATAGVGPLPSQLLNISTRTRVQTGDNVMIGGFIVTGDAPKKVVLRAIGPSLSSSGTPVAGRLDDPTLELLDSAGTRITFNDNWKDSEGRADIEAQGLQPTDDREAAIARTLAPGLYTAIVRGANNSTGIGLVEAYDADRSGSARLANISTRGFVETGDNVMIGGFFVGDQSSGIRVVARAMGPSLKSVLPQALDDPTLQLVDQNGNSIRSNDNWKTSTESAEIQSLGLAPQNDAESALVATLTPAPYTAIVRGKNDTTGIGLVEVYHVPTPAPPAQ
jgi:hypothetical protein